MISGVLWILIVGASIEDPLLREPYRRRALSLAQSEALPADPTNESSQDPRAVVLGEMLFKEPGLSGDGKTSCASCHDPARGFVDGKQHPRGFALIPRDTPALWDVAGQRWWGWDGRWDSLWMQALAPIESEMEMKGDRLQVIRFIAGNSDFKKRYEQIFGPLPSLDGMPPRSRDRNGPVASWMALGAGRKTAVNRAFTNVGKAIAAFERTLRSPTTPFDSYLRALADGDRKAATEYHPGARRGLLLFIGKGNCVSCHNGPLLSDGEFHDTGLLTSGSAARDAGRYGGIQELKDNPFRSSGRYSDDPDGAISGRTERLRRDPMLWGAFRTPALRQSLHTAPYFHDGSLVDLEAVVRFYSRREGARPAGAGHGHHREAMLKPLDLTPGEEQDLLRFLRSLSSGSKSNQG